MNSKHLSTGAQCPPVESGKLRIYSMRFCPYAQRALLVAEAKNIPYDVVNCNLQQKPEFLLEKNPGGKVPTTEDANGILYESLIVADYIDENYPGRKVNSIMPYKKALDRIWIESFDKVATLYHESILLASSAPEEQKETLTELSNSLIPFEKELGRRGTQFFGGDAAPGMLDYMIWPWFERFGILFLFFPDNEIVSNLPKLIPTLMRWQKEMKKDNAVLSSFLEKEVHFQYRKSYLAGTPNYDLLENLAE